ncbi:hypothetical protein B0H15DRAFT_998702 [Mycena belliarum]|uniref:Uncharacterized protein n=1 Tax=Mycena belliarum TaxID=1033014 RepID=A0AAD6UEJ1_9AGAR|nr:hypothetical protein B0H15DRAFT_998702 [Mycena belliae]
MHAACPALDSAAAPSPCHNRPLTVPRAQSRPRIRARGARAARASLPRRAAAAASCAPSPSRAIVAIVAGARLASPSPSYTAAAALVLGSPRAPCPRLARCTTPPALVALPGRRHATLAVLPPRHRHRRRPEPGPIPVVYEHDGRRRPAVWERALPAALTLPVPHAHVNEQPGMGYVPVLPCAGDDADKGRAIDGMRATSPSRIQKRGGGTGAGTRAAGVRRRAGDVEPVAHAHCVPVALERLPPPQLLLRVGRAAGSAGLASNGVRAPCCPPLLPPLHPPLRSNAGAAPDCSPATASNAITGPSPPPLRANTSSERIEHARNTPVPHAQCPPRIRG